MRYLWIKNDANLNWKVYTHRLASKLNRANSVLSKLVSSKVLRSVYFAIIQSHVNYVCIIGVLLDTLNIRYIFSKWKALIILNFALFNAHTTTLFENCNILNFVDIINVEYCIFENNCFKMDSLSSFTENFKSTFMLNHIISEVKVQLTKFVINNIT